MTGREERPGSEERESFPRWVQGVGCIVVAAGVYWCTWATWCETAGSSTVPILGLGLFCTHPDVAGWSLATGAVTSFATGIIALRRGRNGMPFFVAATVLVGAKALTLAIQVLVRMP